MRITYAYVQIEKSAHKLNALYFYSYVCDGRTYVHTYIHTWKTNSLKIKAPWNFTAFSVMRFLLDLLFGPFMSCRCASVQNIL